MAALAGCLTSGIATNAALFDVPIDGLDIDMEGDIDLRGMLGHDKSVRSGFSDIRYTVTIQSPASEDKVRRCKETIDRKSPVGDTLANPVTSRPSFVYKPTLSGAGGDAGRGQLHLHQGAHPVPRAGGRRRGSRRDLPRRRAARATT